MANPYGNIAGVSDQSEPGWQERLLKMMEDAESTSRRSAEGIRKGRLNISCDDEFVALLHAAARTRNINAAAYARRAITAFAAADLGIEPEQMLQYAPAPSTYGRGRNTFSTKRTADDGTGYGVWEVKV